MIFNQKIESHGPEHKAIEHFDVIISGLSSGVYLYKLRTPKFAETKTILLVGNGGLIRHCNNYLISCNYLVTINLIVVSIIYLHN